MLAREVVHTYQDSAAAMVVELSSKFEEVMASKLSSEAAGGKRSDHWRQSRISEVGLTVFAASAAIHAKLEQYQL